jgi:hypothetical protein
MARVRRVVKWLLVLVLVLALGGGIYLAPRIYRLCNIGAGYIAKQMCSCVFVGERDFAACRVDMPPDMVNVHAELLAEGNGVRAWVRGVVSREARYTPGTGCTLY